MTRRTPTGNPLRGRPQAGFTLLGLLFLVAGLGLAMAALGTMWHTAAQREKERELLFIGNQYLQAIESFWNMPLPVGTPRRLPKDFDELIKDPRFPTTVRHLRKIWRDPMTGETEWGLVKEPDGGLSGVHSLSVATPFKRASFPSAYAQFEDAESYRDWVFRYDPAQSQLAAQAAAAATSQAAARARPPAAGADD